jgi:hypothetical protein
MSTTAEKLTYLNDTKGKIKDSINLTGAGITNNDTFRSYAVKLRDGLVNVLNNGTATLYNNFPKVSGTGSSISLSNTLEAPMFTNKFDGDTLQDGTPTPSTPIEIQGVEGIQNITIGDGTDSDSYEVNLEGKNLLPFTENKITLTATRDDYTYYLAGYEFQLEAGIQYVISMETDGEWGSTAGTDTVEAYLQNVNTGSNTRITRASGFTITPSNTNTYRLRLDVNKNGTTHSFWNIQIEKGNQPTTYVPYREPIKLYNGDYITGTPDNWSVVGNWKEVIFNGSESTWGSWNVGTVNRYYVRLSDDNVIIDNGYCDYFILGDFADRSAIDNDLKFFVGIDNNLGLINFRYDSITTLANFKTWLSTHNTKVVYKLATPTTTPITDTYLISQLNALYNAKSCNGQTNISVSGNLPMILDVSALKDEI